MNAVRGIVLLLSLFVYVSVSAETRSTQAIWISAISNDQVEILDQLLRSAEQADMLLPLVASNGKNALMVACKQGELTLAKRLVALGADINGQTNTGGTPFMFAVLGNHLAVAKWLHGQGAWVNAQGSNGWSAIMIAAAKGLQELVAWLISAGADINVVDVYRFTPLMRAVDNRHRAVSKVLLESPGILVNVGDEADNTALHYAVANGDVATIKLLLRHDADPGVANRDGTTPAEMSLATPELWALFGLRQ